VITWRDLRAHTAQQLREADIDTADTEARWIVEEASGLDAAELIAEEDAPAMQRCVAHLDAMVARRLAGEPIQYVLGHWDFRGLDLQVDSRVLIPRPETEVVAQHAIDAAVARGATRAKNDAWAAGAATMRVADLGTGSGAIALALVNELRDVEVWAVEASRDALAVARGNLAGVGSPGIRVRLTEGSWFAALPDELRGSFAVIVSNPPYLAESELADLDTAVRDHEPVGALVSGPSGLEDIETILRGAPDWLTDDGAVVLEIAPDQAASVLALAGECGFRHVRVEPDLAGRDRVVVAQR